MKKVEYHQEMIPVSTQMGVDAMTRLGEEGWHLGGVWPGRPEDTSSNIYAYCVYYFWREKPE